MRESETDILSVQSEGTSFHVVQCDVYLVVLLDLGKIARHIRLKDDKGLP